MCEKNKLTEEQEALLEKSGVKNDWVVGLVFIIIFLAIVGINIFCRFNDNRKLEELEYTQGVVTSRKNYEEWNGRKRHISDSIIVKYTPEGSDTKLYFRDSDGPYEFIRTGDILGVYYEKRHPEKAFISKVDWLTRVNVRADINYEAALIVSVFPLGIGLFFFAGELNVRKNIRKNKFKQKKSDGLYPDENLHELSRMSNYKRSWAGAWGGLSLLYVIFMVIGTILIYKSLTTMESENTAAFITGIFFVLLAQGAAVAVFFTVRFVHVKKRIFIKGFMADDATLVYKNRQKAAKVLWKHVRRYMESEPPWSRYKYDYSRLWLEKYEEKIEKLIDKGCQE
ncbi:MAG: DUF3592 domain-containing protein [Saccharofermentans sp.]|nr:DUF3592 domain-containing protein [Saccharofermentans sp.]